MVVGLEKFAEHFADFKDRYVLIGGAATWLVLDEAGIEPRATKDLDIVLCLESLDPEFGPGVWCRVLGLREVWRICDSGKKFGGQKFLPVPESLSARLPSHVGVVLAQAGSACFG